MADIFDEAINIVIEKGNQTWEELKVIKALKLGKLYKELAEIRLELFKACASRKPKEPPHYPELRRLYGVLKEIEELEK